MASGYESIKTLNRFSFCLIIAGAFTQKNNVKCLKWYKLVPQMNGTALH